MSRTLHLPIADLAALDDTAARLAAAVSAPAVLALSGRLGAGKTAFARAFIRALAPDLEPSEIASPTFALLQEFQTPRGRVHHADLYRLSDPAEAAELGLDELAEEGIVLIEWPDRLGDSLPSDRLDIALRETGEGEARELICSASGRMVPWLDRFAAIAGFVDGTQWRVARWRYLQGDASARRYLRLVHDGANALLMDAPEQADGPPVRDGLSYSAIAHLAESVTPFVAVADALRAAGVSAPRIHSHDLEAGLLLVEDFGDAGYASLAREGADMAPLYEAATDMLVALRLAPPPHVLPLPDGSSYRLPAYSRSAMAIECDLLPEWYWPACGVPGPEEAVRQEFEACWSDLFDELHRGDMAGWVLRDYHSPNLLWLEEREGPARVGVIDFQDAVRGPWAYDLASLLQDARLTLPSGLEQRLLDRYCEQVAAADRAFDRAALETAYAILGAQRATKILGIFCRLAQRDDKPGYLTHLPRVYGNLQRNLTHPRLERLARWYRDHLPDPDPLVSD